MKIEFELRMLLHLCLREKYDLEIIETLLYLLKERQNLEIYQDVIVSSEESIANESWFQKVLAIELITVRMMILKQSKRRRTFFRRRKFDVLIESISLRVLSTKECSAFIDEISFSYLSVWNQYLIILW